MSRQAFGGNRSWIFYLALALRLHKRHFLYLQGWISSKVITYLPGEKGSRGRVEVVALKGTRRLLVAIKAAITLARFAPNAPPTQQPPLNKRNSSLAVFSVSPTFLKGPRLFRKTTQGRFYLTLSKSHSSDALCVYSGYCKHTAFQVELCMFPLRSEKKGWFLNGLDFINCSIRNPFATMQLSDWQFPHCNGPFRYGSH